MKIIQWLLVLAELPLTRESGKESCKFKTRQFYIGFGYWRITMKYFPFKMWPWKLFISHAKFFLMKVQCGDISHLVYYFFLHFLSPKRYNPWARENDCADIYVTRLTLITKPLKLVSFIIWKRFFCHLLSIQGSITILLYFTQFTCS